MSDQLKRALSGAVTAATPEAPPPFDDVLARRDQRRRRTRGALALGAVAAATATVVVVTNLGGPDRDDSAPPVATDGTTTPTTSRATLEPAPLDGDIAPPLVLAGPDGPVEALRGSSCWGNGCFDATIPAASDAPDVGRVAPLDAAFPVLGQWTVTLGELDGGYGCATYPGLLEPVDDTHFRLTPSGPDGKRLASYFTYAGGGDTSGFWRWTVRRDGTPLSWLKITQNTPSSGGMADLTLYVDDAAVDGDVSARVTVTAADGSTDTFDLTDVEQHCKGDGFAELSVPPSLPQRRIDDLGPAPYDYAVDLTVDGVSYAGTGSWSGEGTDHGGDARLTFEAALPLLR